MSEDAIKQVVMSPAGHWEASKYDVSGTIVASGLKQFSVINLQVRWPENDPWQHWEGLRNHDGEQVPYHSAPNQATSLIWSNNVEQALYDNPLAEPLGNAVKYDGNIDGIRIRD